MIKDKKMLVVSAHAADYVWRSGGIIAKYIEEGADVHVVVLSHGVRGESNDLWKQDANQTYEKVRDIREGESRAAAEILGIKNIEFWSLTDYPIPLTENEQFRLVKKIREVVPDIIISHDKYDIMNPDHNDVHNFVHRCSVMSTSSGYQLEGTKAVPQMKIYGFEPHQPEVSGFMPGSFVDITQVYDKKIAAMKCFQAQDHLIEYYTYRAFVRGNHARRLSNFKEYKYAECFTNFFPVVGPELY